MDLAAVRPSTADTLEAELLGAYPGLVRRLALVLRDEVEAEDVAQSAFARALEGRERFHGGDARAWLFTIGLRLAFNEMRRRQRLPLRAVESPRTWAMQTDPDLWAALAEIEAQPRAALLLSVLDGYTHDEIAAMLDVRPGTVSSWLSRTKERLREVLRED
jgi:RNA polymerase sigma-70 factor (ECF subfamily)